MTSSTQETSSCGPLSNSAVLPLPKTPEKTREEKKVDSLIKNLMEDWHFNFPKAKYLACADIRVITAYAITEKYELLAGDGLNGSQHHYYMSVSLSNSPPLSVLYENEKLAETDFKALDVVKRKFFNANAQISTKETPIKQDWDFDFPNAHASSVSVDVREISAMNLEYNVDIGGDHGQLFTVCLKNGHVFTIKYLPDDYEKYASSANPLTSSDAAQKDFNGLQELRQRFLASNSENPLSDVD
ncbi:MAG: hypothetical protein KGJ02_06410 [Verrucomicrobiota bacterium]|nr:hypothetical protein [Verrucomicrobiota bacterium]